MTHAHGHGSRIAMSPTGWHLTSRPIRADKADQRGIWRDRATLEGSRPVRSVQSGRPGSARPLLAAAIREERRSPVKLQEYRSKEILGRHGVPLLANDVDFAAMHRAGIPLVLISA